MKIALLIHSINRVEGISRHALHFAKAYTSLGHQVDLYCVELNRQAGYGDLLHGLHLSAVRESSPGKEATRPGNSLARFLADIQGWTSVLADQYRLSRLVPDGYDVIHPHGNLVIWAAAAVKWRYSTSLVWLCNDYWPAVEFGRKTNEVWKMIKRGVRCLVYGPLYALDQAAVLMADQVVVLSERVQKMMVAHYRIKLPIIIRAGVDAHRFKIGFGAALRSRLGIPEAAFVLVTVCSLLPHRRIEDVIHAVGLLAEQGRNVRYLVVGDSTRDPEYTNRLRTEASVLGLTDKVLFAGSVPDDELSDFYHAGDVFVWAADENQSWGMAGMEAMAAGRPLIVSTGNGLAEVLTHARNALLVPPGSASQIAEAIVSLMEQHDLRDALVRAGLHLVITDFTWESMAAKTLAVMTAQVGRAPRAEGGPIL